MTKGRALGTARPTDASRRRDEILTVGAEAAAEPALELKRISFSAVQTRASTFVGAEVDADEFSLARLLVSREI